MILFLGLILLLMLSHASVGDQREGYLLPERTTAVRGLFILLIFVSHCEGYLPPETGLMGTLYRLYRLLVGQGVVVMFLFYSGFGVCSAIQKRGRGYLTAMPRSRIIKTWLHFALPVLVYALIWGARGNPLSVGELLGALVGYVSVGNSAWFIFDILCAYCITFVCFSLISDTKLACHAVLLLSLLFVAVMTQVQDTVYYNTFLCYPLGLYYAHYRPAIEDFLWRKQGRIWRLLALTVCAYGLSGVLLMPVYEDYPVLYSICTLLFCIGFLLFTMRVNITNSALQFFGKHAFSMFILMRLPMLRLEEMGLAESVWSFLPIAFLLTLVLAQGYDRLLAWLDERLFPANGGGLSKQ